MKNDGAAPVEVSIEASLPKGASAVCKLVEAEVSANDGALGPSKWLLLTADPPAQVDGVTGPLLELTWIFSTDSYGDCDVQALVKDENSGQSMLLEKLTHIIPEVNATAVNLGGLIATDRGLTKWDEVDQTAPPAIPEIDMHMKGSVLIFSAVGTVQTAALGKKDYGHFEISPTVTAKALELLDPECKVVDACSVDAFLDLRTNTPKPVHLMTLSSVNSGDTISVCLKGDYMDGSSSDDHKELCVIVHGINDSTLNAVAGPDYLVGIPVPHV